MSRDTKEEVAKVGRFAKAHPNRANDIFDEIQSISESCIRIFLNHSTETEEADFRQLEVIQDCWFETVFQEMIERNHQLLCEMGVGHPKLDRICRLGKKYGLCSKLTGAGGGGCAVTLLNSIECFLQ